MLPTSAVSSGKERLRTLVGLDKNEMNSNILSAPNGQGRTDLPNSAELLSLLHKQDQIISELYGELERCKNDISTIKDQSTAQFDQNQRIFDELRAQLIKNNIGKDVLASSEIVPANGAASAAYRYSQVANAHYCRNCRELRDHVLKLERDKHKLHNRILDCEADLGQLRRQDAECFRKVRESVSIADQAVLEKNETLIQLKHAQNRIESLEKELKDAFAEHQNVMEHYRNSTQQRYEGEIETLKTQLNSVTKSESELKSRLNTCVQERDDLMTERALAKDTSSQRRKEIEERLKQLREENAKLSRISKELKEALAETEQSTKLQNLELTEKMQYMERQLTESRAGLENSKSTLTLTKKENADLRERLAIGEKEIWQLRQWKQRLEIERDEVVRNNELAMREAVRIAELKHDQTKTELERLLTSQNGLIFRLKEECKLLTDQLERVTKNRRSGGRSVDLPEGVPAGSSGL